MANQRVALLAIEPDTADGEHTPFSLGVRRLQACLLADAELSGIDVRLLESKSTDVDTWVAEVEAIEADIVGFSTYVWSFPTFVEVARRIKQIHPNCMTVLGGPSARPAMLSLPPWRSATTFIDALVPYDGEITFRELVRSTADSRSTLTGLYLPTHEGWLSTGPPPPIALDDLPSPFRMKLVPANRLAPFESCRGSGETDQDVFSQDYLTDELSMLQQLALPAAQLVDASLNRNARAFDNLAAAEQRVGFFKNASLQCTLDPTNVTDQHLEFLHSVAHAKLHINLHAFIKEQPDAMPHLSKVIDDLSRFADVEVEMTVGLPGDSPTVFRKVLDQARELPCRVRIFHCLVLPDALMTRAPASYEMLFDPRTLRMRACLGWSEDNLERERNRLIEMAYREGGEITLDMWSFPGPKELRRHALLGTTEQLASASAELQRVMEQGIREATSGSWTFVQASARPGELVVIMKTRDGALVLEMRPASSSEQAYKVVDGIAFGYRCPQGERMSEGALRLLDRVLHRLRGPASAALGLMSGELSDAPFSARVRRVPV